MNFLLTVLGWLIALACAEITVSHLARLAITTWVRRWRSKTWHLDGYWLTVPLYGSACIAALTLLGVIAPAAGALLAALLFAAAAWILGDSLLKGVRQGKGRFVARRIGRALISQAKGGPAYLRDDFRTALRLLRGQSPPRPPITYEPPEPAPVTEPRPDRTVPLPREVPSVRDDPALGTVPAAEEVGAGLAGAGVAVPPAWAALIAEVAAFEPADDEELMLHLAGEAAGALGWGEGVRARADNLLHATGLDPAYVAGHLELADEIADLAAAVALVDRRFHVIYGAIREWVGNGGILPHRAREFFGGSDTAPATDADDQAA